VQTPSSPAAAELRATITSRKSDCPICEPIVWQGTDPDQACPESA
jgi:hypothetical protein